MFKIMIVLGLILVFSFPLFFLNTFCSVDREVHLYFEEMNKNNRVFVFDLGLPSYDVNVLMFKDFELKEAKE